MNSSDILNDICFILYEKNLTIFLDDDMEHEVLFNNKISGNVT